MYPTTGGRGPFKKDVKYYSCAYRERRVGGDVRGGDRRKQRGSH